MQATPDYGLRSTRDNFSKLIHQFQPQKTRKDLN